jgi:integral membrane protein
LTGVRLFPIYRVLALIVGVLLTVLVFVGVPLEYLATKGTAAQHAGETITMVVGVAHGWLYIAYLVVSFALARRLRWSVPFSALVLLAGLIPILIFWVERQVNTRVRREHPEMVAPLA